MWLPELKMHLLPIVRLRREGVVMRNLMSLEEVVMRNLTSLEEVSFGRGIVWKGLIPQCECDEYE